MISRHKSKVQKVVKFIIICSSVNDINKNTEEEKKKNNRSTCKLFPILVVLNLNKKKFDCSVLWIRN